MIDRSWYTRPAGAPDAVSAGGVVVRVENGQTLVALVTEREHPDYVLPKGHLEAGESALEAARREVGEEAGFHDLTCVRELVTIQRLNFDRTKWKTIHFFLFTTDETEPRPLEPENHPHVGWFPLDALPPMFWPEQRELLETLRSELLGLSDSS
ncbi:MAG: NUDIX domain-containing protein [Candidatus Hydrogenedentes bacterium]|nr:NUDIX domain-containing protein [Candidatus Hydrogenedentota bacterium]